MNKTDDLMPIIASPANLLQAWRGIRGNIPKYRHHKCVGPDGISMADFEQDLQCQLSVLRYELLKGRYQPKQPVFFSTAKKDGGERMIAVLAISDRVAQRAVQQVIEPFWEQVFLPCSFGYRPGLSVKNAIEHASHLRKLGNNWVVNGDIDGFFDNLDQKLLIKNFQSRISDDRVVELMRSWLNVGAVKTHITQEMDHASKDHHVLGLPSAKTWLDTRMDVTSHQGRQEWEQLSQLQPQDFDRFSPTDAMYQTPTTQVLLKQVMRQILAGGLMAASGYAKPLTAQAFNALRSLVIAPASKAALTKVLLGTSCAAIAGTAVAGYFVMANNPHNEKGVLQGSPLSPLLANIYLHPFDCGLVRNGYHLVRYADDWLVMSSTEEQAFQAYNEAIRFLARLRLKINQEKTTIISPQDNFHWLGSEIQPVVRKNSQELM
jgi:RNA-directed DNA polymerase